MDETRYFAHSANKNGYCEPLRDHLNDVARASAEFARPFGGEQEAWLAGLLHDLGKYGSLFQDRLKGIGSGLDHWSLGAWAAYIKYYAVPTTFAIQGHHTGLQQANKAGLQSLKPESMLARRVRLTANEETELLNRLQADGLDLPPPPTPPPFVSMKATVAAMLDTRMLFSALVDADWLETEAHFKARPGEQKSYRESPPLLQAEKALARLLEYIETTKKGPEQKSGAAMNILALREKLLADCRNAAQLPPGLFSLSAPTGSGKTLSMLAFALAHAAAHPDRFRRVVVVIPYLSIIEQTAKTYREIFDAEFGDRYLLEHHSLAGLNSPKQADDADGEGPAERARNLAENWDAPLVITTSVQMLESMFANRPRACRKLHRLAGSIILFDEVQTLPVSLAVPTLKALSHLAARYSASIVFATATQPAFASLSEKVRETPEGLGWQPTEIVADVPAMFRASRRTKISCLDPDKPLPWAELAERLAQEEQVLCIVNLKRHALDLLDCLKSASGESGLFHLSTNMCPAHRIKVLAEVRARLKNGERCRLISTQCVEAGVDVDFPTVYRALGPLDAIAQAAGRCNRNGLQDRGEVRVFRPEDDGHPIYPPGGYKRAADVLTSMIKKFGLDWFGKIDAPEEIDRYYRNLYALARPEDLCKKLDKAFENQDFAAVAQLYKLIDKDAVNVLVPYDPEVYPKLVCRARNRNEGLSREWLATARFHAVSIFRPANEAAFHSRAEAVFLHGGGQATDWYFCRNANDYDRLRGFDARDSLHALIG